MRFSLFLFILILSSELFGFNFKTSGLSVEKFEEIRKSCRQRILAQAAELPNENVFSARTMSRDHLLLSQFIGDSQYLKNIEQIHQWKLEKGEFRGDAWSGWYWPISKGVLGYRYGAPDLPYMTTWLEHWEYFVANPMKAFLEANEENARYLSVSEKYDLLLGHEEQDYTKSMWDEGRAYYEAKGEVETWMGICHGWAVASFLSPRPSKTIWVKSNDQKYNIPFYPADIKGLSSHLWANGQFQNHVLGSRCNERDVPTDENDRPSHQKCFDVNPANWHIAVVNRIGRQGRTFVMDAAYDFEVWNHPVLNYETEYYNIVDKQKFDNPLRAMVKLTPNTDDRFKKYRSKNAKYVLGVSMIVEYLTETESTQSEVDNVNHDRTQRVRYVYDLELDEKLNLIGGEWHHEGHPDFLWVPVDGAVPTSFADQWVTGSWLVGKKIPADWKFISQVAAQNRLPLRKVVEAIVQSAH